MSMASVRRQIRRDLTDDELRLAIACVTAGAGSRDAKTARASRCRLRVLRELAADRETA